jgi:predicted deacylase
MSTLPVSTHALRLHQYAALKSGPRLIVLGVVHGNETCGMHAMQRIIQEIDAGKIQIEQGMVTFLPITNPLAYQQQQRQGDRNLNRNFRITEQPQDFEDRIANALGPILQVHDVLLDLHSFHTPGIPFALVGPRNNTGTLEPFQHADQENRLAAHLGPNRIVEGWMETYARGVQRRRETHPSAPSPHLVNECYGIGTTEFMRAHGGYAVTLECGQHQDPNAPEVAYRAIRQTLALLKIAPIPLAAPAHHFEVLQLVDVIDLAHLDDQFAKPWTSFDSVTAGELIGKRHDGKLVQAPADGFIVFPNPKAQPGNEWFYFAQPSNRNMLSS